MFSMACFSASPTCGARSITQTLRVSPITPSLCITGFRFAPRIRDLADKRLYVPGKNSQRPVLDPLIGGSINTSLIERQLGEVLRLAASIQHGTVTPSLILRKLGSYPRQNRLALALHEIGIMERTLLTPEWLSSVGLSRQLEA
jgi:TnpA family transposase